MIFFKLSIRYIPYQENSSSRRSKHLTLGWEGFSKALSPAEMKVIAEDLKDATLFDDRDAFEPGVIEDMPSELHYAQHYLEKAKDFPQLGRFAIRDMGQTVAAGMCIDVEKKEM